jgi:hypothetical protein
MGNFKRNVVSFELSMAEMQQLQSAAAAQSQGSPHLCAREIVKGSLNSQSDIEVMRRLEEIERSILELKTLIKCATFVLLTNGAPRSSAEANEWIRNNMSTDS